MSTLTDSAAVRVDRDGPAARIVLDRAEKRNALSLAVMRELLATLQSAANEPGVRAIVLEGTGPAFSAGHDLSEMIGRDLAFYQKLFDLCTELMETIHRLPQPVIAKVQGIATAAGCQLVASCDLAVAADTARFATPGVNIGLFCSTPMVALSRAVGRKAAMEMLLTGELIDASRAHALGLVNRVVADNELDDAVAALTGQIVAKSPLTLAIGKEAFYRQAEMGLDDAYAYASEVMTRNMLARDAGEGIDAFLGKRQPVWSGT